jgi:hypothetical protein
MSWQRQWNFVSIAENVQYAGMKTGSACALVFAFWSAHAISFAESLDASTSSPADLDAQVASILDNPLPESDYVQAQRCLPSGINEHVDVLDSRHLLFRGNRDVFWLNQLRFNCVGLTDDTILVFDVRDRRLCDMGGFRSVPRNGSMGADFGVSCTLGRFEPITQAQADQLRIALARGAHSPLASKAAPNE